jgi:uncharacterized repeat protein (TIGR02543 family)/uncharacterized repeat protein (TIGR01451 family)
MLFNQGRTALAEQAADTALQEEGTAFADISADEPLLPCVHYLTSKGIFSGFPDGTFKPAESLTRAQAARIMILAGNIPSLNNPSPIFSDVDPSHWAYGEITAAAAAGLLSGYPDGTYKPDNSITRAEAVTLLLNLSGEELSHGSRYIKDVSADNWAYPYIETAVEAGLVEMADGDNFQPDQAIRRGEMARGISAMLTLSPELRKTELTGLLAVRNGSATLITGGGAREITGEVRVGAGSTIITGGGSQAEVVFDDGSGILIDENTEISITSGSGFNYMRKDGTEGAAVDKLALKMEKGRIFGGLASRYVVPVTTAIKKEKYILLASTELPPDLAGLLLAEGEGAETYYNDANTHDEILTETPWWIEPYTEYERVEVDMPWGVAGIRGTFWMCQVDGKKHIVSVAVGKAEVRVAGSTVKVTDNQYTEISHNGAQPAVPVEMTRELKQQWALIINWVMERIKGIEQNLPLPPAPVILPLNKPVEQPPVLLQQERVELEYINTVNAFNEITEQLTAAPQEIATTVQTTGSSSGGGRSDKTAPAVSGNPDGGSVPLDGPIVINFSENIRNGGNYSNITVTDAGGSTVATSTSTSGSTLVITPLSDLILNTVYTVYIPAGALTDLTGNGVNEYRFTFTAAASVGPADTYTVTFDSNGGSAAGSVTASPGTLVSEPAPPTRAGYTFTGWYREAALTTRWNFASNTVTTNTILYAGWANTTPAVNITSPANGAEYALGDSITFSGSAIDSEQGNLSAGLAWTSSIDGSTGSGGTFSTAALSAGIHTITASITDGGGMSGSAQVIITVNAAIPVYTVNYSGNGATGGNAPVDPTSYKEDDIVLVLGNTGGLTRTGYTFDGWNTMANGSGTSYIAGDDTFTMGASGVTLYAVWSANPPAAPAITSITATDTGGNPGLGNGDTVTITFNVATNQPSVVDKVAVDNLVDFGAKTFGADYSGAWSDKNTLVLTVSDAAGGSLAMGDTLTMKAGGSLKTAEGLSAASSSSGIIAGTFGASIVDMDYAEVMPSTVTPTQGSAFSLNISSARDIYGIDLSGSINVRVTSSDNREGTGGAVFDSAVTFTAGAASVPLTLANAGAQTLMVYITGVDIQVVNVTVYAVITPPALLLTSPGNYSAPEAGSAAGTTKIASLSLAGISGATKWQVNVQNEALTAAPALDSIPASMTIDNYIAAAGITIGAGQHLILYATDGSGKVKAYADITVSAGQIAAVVNNITEIPFAAGGSHSLALESGGTVAAWGDNSSGQCNVPAGLSGVKAVAGGGSHSLALRGDGTVAAWGSNGLGQSSLPAGLSGVTAIAGGGWHSLALKGDGTVAAWGSNNYGLSNIPAGLSGVTAISAGLNHSLALKSDGTVAAWGDNSYGQCNVPTGLSGVTAISAGGNHSLALKSDGTVVTWGQNSYGQCSVPAGLSGVKAIAGGGSHSLALDSDGILTAWGNNGYGQGTVPAGLVGVTAISANGGYSLTLQGDGTLAAWGYNGYGQCNVPTSLLALTTNYSAPEAGSAPGTTKIATLDSTGITGAAKWQLLVRDSGLGVPLPDNPVIGANDYPAGADITAAGQHILLLATDSSGNVKAYADITLTADMVNNNTPAAPIITEVLAADTGSNTGLGNGDTITITFDVATNQPPVVDKAAVDSLVDFGSKTFGADYYGVWEDATTLILVLDIADGDLAVGDTLSIKASGGLKTADSLSAASTSSGTIGGSFGEAGTDISGSFTDPNFRQAVWEWLGNSGTPGAFTQQDLAARMPDKSYAFYANRRNISSLAGLENFNDTGLQKLYCYDNLLTNLPSLPASLTWLDCAGNKLDGLPDSLPGSLAHLDCQNNQLAVLPALPTNLIKLYCNGNQLTELPALPLSLAEIWCQVNHLTALPDLPGSLTTLYCYENQLTELPALPLSLADLDCSFNYINVFSGPVKDIIDGCPAGNKFVAPQYRYAYPGTGVVLNGGEIYQVADADLIWQKSYDGTDWTSAGTADLSGFVFATSDSGVATVDSGGLITARGAGTCDINAMYQGINAEYTNAVIPVSVTATALSSGSISGYCFNDIDNDGIFDAGERGQIEWVIELYDTMDNYITSTFSDASGKYSFTEIPSGDYIVREVLESGWAFTYPSDGTKYVTLGTGQSMTDINFGNIVPAPGITIALTANPAAVSVSEAVYYTYTITNTGNVDLFSIVVTDTLSNNIIGYSTALVHGQDTIGEAMFIVPAGYVPGPLENTATVRAVYDSAYYEDTDTVIVTVQ